MTFGDRQGLCLPRYSTFRPLLKSQTSVDRMCCIFISARLLFSLSIKGSTAGTRSDTSGVPDTAAVAAGSPEVTGYTYSTVY